MFPVSSSCVLQSGCFPAGSHWSLGLGPGCDASLCADVGCQMEARDLGPFEVLGFRQFSVTCAGMLGLNTRHG